VKFHTERMNTTMWQNDEELFQIIETRLYTAVVGDIMDRMGLLQQFLPPYVQPLHEDMVVVGRSMPVLEADIRDPEEALEATKSHKPFGLMLEALDDLKAGEVYVCAGASPLYATWGELMSTRARALGARGAVLDGYSRDTRGIVRLRFPTFSRGRYAQDQRPRGKVVDFRTPITIGNATISPGDLIFGDLDGVLTVPREVESDVLRLALERIESEGRVRQAFEREGMSAVAAVAQYGVM